MVQYIFRRALINIPVLIGITMAVFILISLAPGDPLSAYISPELGRDPETLAALSAKFGFDQPLPIRYVNWLGQALQGNLGYRIKNFDPVWTVILQRVPATLMLMATALGIGIVVGIPLGIFSALQK